MIRILLNLFRMHHACALQRLHLVQLYLSCLDFNIQSKDCEGNTCLHYVAITGNCEIAELLIKTAEKMSIRLDQYLNREGEIKNFFMQKSHFFHSGCSAAVLALRYGHIECANQITHRDWDEFFVVPRPLSIYEIPPGTDNHHHPQSTIPTTTIVKKKKNNSPTVKNDIRPSALSFGLLKIIFNESDSTYSTRLAGLCNEKKTAHRRRRVRPKKSEGDKSNPPHSTHYCSTEALANELQASTLDQGQHLSSEENDEINRSSPRMQLLMQQHLSHDNPSNSTLNNYIEPTVSILYESPRTKSKVQRPKTAVISRNITSVNAVGIPSRLSSPKNLPRKSILTKRPNSASVIPKHSTLTSEATTYSQTLYQGRPLSAVLHSQHRHPPAQRTVDSACTIREAKGATSRYNKPEELFGLKPEELFGLKPEELFGQIDYQPRIINRHQTMNNKFSPRPTHIWQDDVDKLVDLYNIHHSSNYRKPAVPPPPVRVNIQSDALGDLVQPGKARRTSISKHSSTISQSRSSVYQKQSTLASLNIPRRNSINRRSSIKLTNA